jgi:hypothetical protein
MPQNWGNNKNHGIGGFIGVTMVKNHAHIFILFRHSETDFAPTFPSLRRKPSGPTNLPAAK